MRASEVTGRRMRNSGLTGTPFTQADEVVRWHHAMQGQDYGLAKWSIGQRTLGLVEGDVDEALAEGSIVRTHVLRPTWHLVARDDVRWLLALTGPRVQLRNERRYRELGLDPRVLARCQQVIGSALEGGGRMTREEIGASLAGAGIDPSGQRLPYIIMHGELEAMITSGGLRGRRHTYALFDERVPPEPREFDRDVALVELTRRYLASHGPATAQDLGWWSSLTIAGINRALRHLGDDVRIEQIDGVTFWMAAAEPGRPPRPSGMHLLPGYDEMVVGFRQSRYVGDPRALEARAAWSEQSLPNGVVLSKGRVAGLWRRTIEPREVRIQVYLYERPEPSARRELEAIARRLGRFVGREAAIRVVRVHPTVPRVTGEMGDGVALRR
jgi:Winged helix DNA-binding domain